MSYLILIGSVLSAVEDSPTIVWLSIAYAIVESIRIYDARLIQAKTGKLVSGVAVEAGGRLLPNWVKWVHYAGWVLFIMILILNWMYAIAFYVFLFLLRVLPVLERIGAFLMHPFLLADPDYSDHEGH